MLRAKIPVFFPHSAFSLSNVSVANTNRLYQAYQNNFFRLVITMKAVDVDSRTFAKVKAVNVLHYGSNNGNPSYSSLQERNR